MSVRRSLVFSFVDRYASLLIGIVSTVILARLLTPAEVGMFSVAMALLSLASTVRDMGAGNYLLQEPNLTPDRIRAVWTVQLGLGVSLAVVVVLLSGPAARFFNEPSIQSIMLVLALNYLVNPLGSLTYAWLMREMRYDAIAIIRFSSTLAGALVSLGLAWRGLGAISLAWGSLCATLFNSAVSVFYRPKSFPLLPGMREVPRVLAFGTRLTASSVLQTVAAASPEFMLGKAQGMASAGFYSRAHGLVALFNRLVTDAVYVVALSLFSKQARAGVGYSAEFLRALSYHTVLSWTFCLAIVFLAQPTVALLYGPQWQLSADLARWLAAAAAIMSPVPLCRAALVGSGKVAPMLKATALTALATVVAASAGAMFGMTALGGCLVAASAISVGHWLVVTRASAQFTWPALARTFKESGLVALCAAVVPAIGYLMWGLTPSQPLLALITGWTGACVGLVVAASLTKHPIASELKKAVSAVRTRFAPRGPSR